MPTAVTQQRPRYSPVDHDYTAAVVPDRRSPNASRNSFLYKLEKLNAVGLDHSFHLGTKGATLVS